MGLEGELGREFMGSPQVYKEIGTACKPAGGEEKDFLWLTAIKKPYPKTNHYQDLILNEILLSVITKSSQRRISVEKAMDKNY